MLAWPLSLPLRSSVTRTSKGIENVTEDNKARERVTANGWWEVGLVG